MDNSEYTEKVNDSHVKAQSCLLRFAERFETVEGGESLTPLLAKFAETGFNPAINGNLPRCLAALSELPAADFTINALLDASAPTVSAIGKLPSAEFAADLERVLKKLHPWRKGPFNLFGVEIDAEWRSNLKWNRLSDGISPLKGKLVLDLGCGNGYYGLRMIGEGAERVVG
ncbi:MAG: DUF1698 domain-containing protein, partial [Victivallales bacterium]|nr:DUF1698 domain-containing protein [Victivallales bacterium]